MRFFRVTPQGKVSGVNSVGNVKLRSATDWRDDGRQATKMVSRMGLNHPDAALHLNYQKHQDKQRARCLTGMVVGC